MSEGSNNANLSLTARTGRQLRHWRKEFAYRRRRLTTALANRWRLLRAGNLGYVIMRLGGPLPERDAPPRSFWERRLPFVAPPPLSLETLCYTLDVIGAAQNVHGVIILLQPLSIDLATCQSVRAAIQRLRAAGKRVIVYSEDLSLRNYYVAAAADLVVAPPVAEFSVLGMRMEALYLKQTLADAGVQVDVIRISPFKSAFNQLTETTMVAEERAQLEWLLDEQFDQVTAALAADRGKTQAEIAALINWAPFGAPEAVTYGLLDAAVYDDALANLLARRYPQDALPDAEPAQVRLTRLGEAARKLTRVVRRRHDAYIGVVQIEGPIMMQPVNNPLPVPLPLEQASVAAEAALTPLLRRAEQDDALAALLIYVNSPGGDSLASDLIWQQIERIRSKKPVVVYMGDTAASGGYYVAAPAHKIIAQPATITGSIGVITARVSTTGLYERLNINQVSLQRGKHAGLYSSSAPLSDEERATIWGRVLDSYTQFKRAVASGRDLPLDTLDPIAEGRVWAGRQAQAHGLVDELGDFSHAVATARTLAALPAADSGIDVPVRNLYAESSRYVIPPAVEAGAPALTLADWTLRLARSLQHALRGQLDGRLLYLMPYRIHFD